MKAPDSIRGSVNFVRTGLLGLIHRDPATLALGSFLRLGLLHPQSFVDPVVRGLEVLGSGSSIIALDIGPLTIHQVHVCHRIVIIRTKLNGLIQAVNALLDKGRVLGF